MILDEMSAFLASLSSYNSSSSSVVPQFILLHDGRLIRIDRKTGEEREIVVHNPSLTKVGAVQPKTLVDVFTPVFRDSGYEARILWTVLPSSLKDYSDEDLPEDVLLGYRHHLADLMLWRLSGDSPTVIGLHDGAKVLFRDFYNELASLELQVLSGPLRAFIAKLPNHCLRAAGLLAASWSIHEGRKVEQISTADMKRAIAFARWCLPEYVHMLESTRLSTVHPPAPSLPPRERALELVDDEFSSQQWAEAVKQITATSSRPEGIGDRATRRWCKNLKDAGRIEAVSGSGDYRKIPSGDQQNGDPT